MACLEITAENFEAEVMQSAIPVLLDFWAVWCGPCRMVSPIVDEIAGEITNAKVGKINVDEQQMLAQRFHIESIPTLVVVEHGKIKTQRIGLQSKAQILSMLG